MRLVHWLFAIGAALFIFGIGFVVIGARAARDVPAAPATPAITPVATVLQLMLGVANPAANAVFSSVQTNITEKGVEEIEPRTDEEWQAVGSSAAALVEVANLLQVEGRAVDRGDWITMAQALATASKQAMAAAVAKNKDAILDAGSEINTTCDNCHMRYSRQ